MRRWKWSGWRSPGAPQREVSGSWLCFLWVPSPGPLRKTKMPRRAPRGGRFGPCAQRPQRAAVPPPGASAAWGLRAASRPPGELETVLWPRPRGGEVGGRRGRYCPGSVRRSCRRGRPWCLRASTRLPVLARRRSLARAAPPPAAAAAAAAAARAPCSASASATDASRSRHRRSPRARRTRCQAARPSLFSSPLPARCRRHRRRRPRPRLPPPPSFPARVVANRRPPSCGCSRPDPRQPSAPALPKHPVFAAARGGSPEGSLGFLGFLCF
ncbi:serine/arginine repetitive matrix protein 1-like [Felis catus]|uniref:serine/arginine repetitive matrix protein 1-like n=1 Tax=Felis catus TaxID=9685 RepID=UPI001D1A0AD8|nr:serine/arginine repetitive matrix protein 1-like [Felis catus]XP_044897918.1 serine/arginine repetitive matrix protein 1-like [Felis catus]XP_044897919.1 serine/arginine repetitive matrix protein 1-like [Felis catus]